MSRTLKIIKLRLTFEIRQLFEINFEFWVCQSFSRCLLFNRQVHIVRAGISFDYLNCQIEKLTMLLGISFGNLRSFFGYSPLPEDFTDVAILYVI